MAGLSLGFTPWQNIVHVLLPAAGRGMLSGVILAVGRAAEDTAVILLTGVVANSGLPSGILSKYEALPFHIFFLAAEARSDVELAQGFGAALILLMLTAALFLVAYYLKSIFTKTCTEKPVDLETTVVVESLHVGFAGREVLHNLSAEFHRGQLAVILGRSGSGKTTFLRAFNRLNECFPQSETKGSLRLGCRASGGTLTGMPCPSRNCGAGWAWSFKRPTSCPGPLPTTSPCR